MNELPSAVVTSVEPVHRPRRAGWTAVAALAAVALSLLGLQAVARPTPATAEPTLYLPWPAGRAYAVTANQYAANHVGFNNEWAVDFGMSSGQEVAASAPGVVRSAGWDSAGGGNLITINHGDNVCTWYAHLSAFSVSAGQSVGQGQVIGRSGATGAVTGPHLHWGKHNCSTGQSLPVATAETGSSFNGTVTSQNRSGPPAGSPIGNVDVAQGLYGGGVRLLGWVMDPDAMRTPTTIHVYVDGPAGSGAAAKAFDAYFPRPDVAAAYPGSSAEHGFHTGFMGLAPGSHTLYVYGINVGGTPGDNVLIKQVTVDVPTPAAGSPIGNGDGATGSLGAVAPAGWSFDPDAPTAPVRIHAYVDGPAGSGTGVDLGWATRSRPDVANVYPHAGPAHGFEDWITNVPPGPHVVYLYAINAAGGGENPLIGIVRADVPSGSPRGAFDEVVDRFKAVQVRGWAVDPDAATEPVDIHVYVDGPSGSGARGVNIGAANRTRSDVGGHYPGAGPNHGFSATIPDVSPGKHTLYVYAIDRKAPGENVLIGTRTATVTADIAAPDISPPNTSITSGPAGVVQPGRKLFRFTSSEPGSSFQCRWDRGAWASCTSPHSRSVTAAGRHTFAVRARDRAGNVDASPAVRGFTVSAKKPGLKPKSSRSLPLSIRVAAVSRRSKLRIDVNPNWVAGNYRVVIKKRVRGGWRAVRAVRTKGALDKRTVNLRKGRYRVTAAAQHGRSAATSRVVRLRR